VAEERLQLDREKAKAVLEALEAKASAGEPLTPRDVKQFRELYGLYDEQESEVRSQESEDSEPQP
jgi:hypothetical protein